MHKEDKELHTALKWIIENKGNVIAGWKLQNSGWYNEYIPKHIEDILKKKKFAIFKTQSINITELGKKELRVLDVIKMKYWSLWISILALIISILAYWKAYHP